MFWFIFFYSVYGFAGPPIWFYNVPSGSMEPTLLIRDELLATKFPYGYSAASLPAFVVLPTS